MVLKTIRKMKFTVIFMTVLFAGGLLAAGCSCNKGEKSEQKVDTGAKTQETSTKPTPAPESGQENDRMKSHGPPPEITEPCKGLNAGDSCTVVLTGRNEIPGICKMSKMSNELACLPKPRPGKPGAFPYPPQQKKSE